MSGEILLDTTGRQLTDKSFIKQEPKHVELKNSSTETISKNENTPVELEESISNEIKNNLARSLNRKIDYNIHQESNEIVIQVLDGETGEVIREIPQQDFVRLIDQTSKFNKSMLDETA